MTNEKGQKNQKINENNPDMKGNNYQSQKQRNETQ